MRVSTIPKHISFIKTSLSPHTRPSHPRGPSSEVLSIILQTIIDSNNQGFFSLYSQQVHTEKADEYECAHYEHQHGPRFDLTSGPVVVWPFASTISSSAVSFFTEGIHETDQDFEWIRNGGYYSWFFNSIVVGQRYIVGSPSVRVWPVRRLH